MQQAPDGKSTRKPPTYRASNNNISTMYLPYLSIISQFNCVAVDVYIAGKETISR